MKIAVETWAPEYGSPLDIDVLGPPSETLVDAEVERSVGEWGPIDPADDALRPTAIYFVDGVRRIDARVWITPEDGPVHPGFCASFAAGVTRCGESAQVISAEVARRIISRAGPGEFETDAGSYSPRTVKDDDLESLFGAWQLDMRAMEVTAARDLDLEDDAVVVFDGPLGDGRDVTPALGYIKTHRVAYLDDTLGQVVPLLQVGQRTPLFVIGERWTRYTWYLRLPSPVANPWSGVVRCEVSGDQAVEQAVQMADFSASTLPRFVSEPHKDPRAPQNLYPIAALERELRRRLGDARFVERALRKAAAGL